MGTAAALSASFAREMTDRLAARTPDELAERTGLQVATVVGLSAGELFSWEVVSACLSAADTPPAAMVALRNRWVQVEAAWWAEREPQLLKKIESELERAKAKAGRGAFDKKAFDRKVFEAHRPQAPWRKMLGPSAGYVRWGMTDLADDRRLPDPAASTSVKQFYEKLKQLHLWAGSPSANEIEYRSWGALSHSTANTMLGPTRHLQGHQQGRGLDRNNVRYLVAVFGLPPAEVARWGDAYDHVRRLPVVDPEQEAAAARAELAAEIARRRAAEEALAEALQRSGRTGRLAPTWWRTIALALAVALPLTLIVTDTGLRAGAGVRHVLQAPEAYRLVPGPRGVRVPLDIGPGEWALSLRLRLAGMFQADTCVHGSRAAYQVRRQGAVLHRGTFERGRAELTTPPLPLGTGPGRVEIVLVVTVPPLTGDGCEFLLDPTGTTLSTGSP
ncbi:hypothetical protein [Acrocarpospora catenulata]|uniref:hypothetical protein n=1 Tax=Acrocarpospora catenulata TaxID=2836182 RepID=UPI001BDAAD83|nr:hypothetical protein [Acrocarpospora catenulata]